MSNKLQEVIRAKAKYAAAMETFMGKNWRLISKRLKIYNVSRSQAIIDEIKQYRKGTGL